MRRLMIGFFGVTCVLYALAVTWAARVIPPGRPVPTHWTGAAADDWAAKPEAVGTWVALGLGTAALFAGVLLLWRRSATLAGLNIPHKDYWTRRENLPTARRRATTDFAFFAGLTMLMLSSIPVSTVQATATPGGARPGWSEVFFVLYVAAVLLWTVWLVTVRWRVPPEKGAAPHRF